MNERLSIDEAIVEIKDASTEEYDYAELEVHVGVNDPKLTLLLSFLQDYDMEVSICVGIDLLINMNTK
jgi:hypothetical protein